MVLNNRIVENFLNYLEVIKSYSKHTILEYKLDINMLFKYIYNERYNEYPEDLSFADINFIKTITLEDFYSFISYCKSIRQCSVSTCNRKIISIRQFWKYLFEKSKLLSENISCELECPRIPRRLPVFLQLEDCIRLLIASEECPRAYCIITIFLNCGLRLSELSNLNLSDINNDYTTVVGKGNRERKIYLTPAVRNAISKWIIARTKYKFSNDALFISNRGTRLSNRSIELCVKKYIKKANLDEKITPHKLRHTAATLLYTHGKVDIKALKEILGHANISSTEIYTHTNNIMLQNAINSNPLSNIVNRNK